MKKKVLIAAGGYFPAETYGGPPNSIRNFCELFKDKYDFYIVAFNFELHNYDIPLKGINKGWNNRSECKVIYLKKSELNNKTYNSILKEIRPELVFINSIFDYNFSMKFLLASMRQNKKVLLAPRGQLLEGALKKKSILKKIYIFFFKIFMLNNKDIFWNSTSQEETLSIKHFFKSKNILEFPNIPRKINFIEKTKVTKNESLEIVYISRIVDKKNLLFAIKILSLVKVPINFSVFGPLEDKEYWNKCQREIRKLPKNVKVLYKGSVEPVEVMKTFSDYDLFFFPTFSENFGHVIIESLSAGCPVLLSDQTPWQDLEQKNAGYVASLNDIEKYVRVIEDLYFMSSEEIKKMRVSSQNYVKEKFDFERIYLDILSKLESIKF